MDTVKLTKIIAEAIKNDETLNENHYVCDIDGQMVMYNPFTYDPCLSIMRKMEDGDRKEFDISIKEAK
tara:strand:- start:27 stop:230 length:204 start_codon:yes stop_codon:yes gene_type:complete